MLRVKSASERNSSANHRSPRRMTKDVIREQGGPPQCLQSRRVAGCPASIAAPFALSSAHRPCLLADSVHGYLRGSCAVTTPDKPPRPASVTFGAILGARTPRRMAGLSGGRPPKRRSRR